MQNPKELALANLGLPFLGIVSAGFPSPAQDYLEPPLIQNLHKILVKNPSSTFLCQITGDSMAGDGIGEGDWAIVDKAVKPGDGKLVVVTYLGELLLKRIQTGRDRFHLVSSNPLYPPLEWYEDDEVTIWGIVTFIIKKF